MITPGRQLELLVEKPAAGGRMIARHEGRVIFVLGAIPGERVLVRIDRVERQLAFSSVIDILEASPDRREPFPNPLCGGCVYSHITYERQLALKGELVADAFVRLGRIPLAGSPHVTPSPEDGYRMRARFHVQGNELGFFAERSHAVCDARQTRQVSAAAIDAVTSLARALQERKFPPASLELTENIHADERVVSVELLEPRLPEPGDLAALLGPSGLTGCILRTPDGRELAAGVPFVVDSLRLLLPDAGRDGELRRGPRSFFQANRFLLPHLVREVVHAAGGARTLIDLYAGVGLFSATLALSGGRRVIAVEGSRASSQDLAANAAQFDGAVRVHVASVEAFLANDRTRAEAIVVDPPRSGISKEAMTAVARRGAPRVVYVSCDPATMARDARRLLDAGYSLASLRVLDLFPNTPHVESVGVFDASGDAFTSGPVSPQPRAPAPGRGC